MAVTMSDVARKVGVTKTTVSYVLNPKTSESVSKGTKEKVLRAVKDLGYKHNLLAKHLRENKSFVVGLLVPQISGLYTSFVRGIEKVLKQNGYLSYLLDNSDLGEANRAIELYHQRRIDGLILVGPISDSETYISKLRQDNIPHLVLFWQFEDNRIVTVGVDEIRCARLATEHLISLGHKEIVFLTGTGHWNVEKDKRFFGYQQALANANIDLDSSLVIECGWNSDSGYNGVKQLLKRSRIPTAIFCFSDLLAYGALCALYESQIKVPEFISVIGIDDREFSAFTNPPLTTIRLPGEEIGAQGAKQLLKMIAAGSVIQVDPIVLETELVIRKSTGTCRGNN